MRSPFAVLALLVAVLAGCAAPLPQDPLPSWRAGANKAEILAFVAAVTDPGSARFVPVPERVAVFDNDGTLLPEKPFALQEAFVHDRVRSQAGAHPEWANQEPFNLVLAGDEARLQALGIRSLGPLAQAVQTGIPQADLDAAARAFILAGRHPRLNKPWTGLLYQPMRELIRLLESRDFAVWIVSGGSTEFVRIIATDIASLPSHQVIGSTGRYRLEERAGVLELVRVAGTGALNVGPFKAVHISLATGRRPIIAVGNSDGDLEMLRFAESANGTSLVLVVDHDDAAREFAYREGADRVLATAAARNWRVVSIARDFATVFAPLTNASGAIMPTASDSMVVH